MVVRACGVKEKKSDSYPSVSAGRIVKKIKKNNKKNNKIIK